MPCPRIVQRAGLAGFAFFAVKGLFWLTVPFIVAMSGCWE